MCSSFPVWKKIGPKTCAHGTKWDRCTSCNNKSTWTISQSDEVLMERFKTETYINVSYFNDHHHLNKSKILSSSSEIHRIMSTIKNGAAHFLCSYSYWHFTRNKHLLRTINNYARVLLQFEYCFSDWKWKCANFVRIGFGKKVADSCAHSPCSNEWMKTC